MAFDDLELTARRRGDGLRFRTVRVSADPHDSRKLLQLLTDIARDQDQRSGDGWLSEYELVVVAPGRSEFTVAGGDDW